MTQQIIIYTQESCGHCQEEKHWLTNKGISFEERDIRKNPEYMKEALDFGAQATPVTVIKNSEEQHVILGYDKEKIEQLLA